MTTTTTAMTMMMVVVVMMLLLMMMMFTHCYRYRVSRNLCVRLCVCACVK